MAGVGSGALQGYDEVCVLLGADVSFIMSPKNSPYALFRECYVHGIMQSQAYQA